MCYATTRRSIFSINAARFASAAANSFAASFAVLQFEPHTTIPPSNAATAAALAAFVSLGLAVPAFAQEKKDTMPAEKKVVVHHHHSACGCRMSVRGPPRPRRSATFESALRGTAAAPVVSWRGS